MKPNELKIGNWVKQLKGNTHKFEQEIQFSIDDFELMRSYPMVNVMCEPIKITEEWLLKLGFGKEKSYAFSIEVIEGIFIDITFTISGSVTVKLMNDDFIIVPPHIQYIHQLQNLYHSLKGEEL
jgi:hypothetical protein